MQDFTLVIPTYNRPKQLQALLTYLAAQQPRCRILILDSSQPEQRHANRKIAELANFKLEYAEFPSETHPFDKFREGLHKVTTEFCALCADDDLVVLDGVQRCLDALRSNPSASVAQGYSFSFLCQHDGDMDLGNILYFTPTIDDATPLARLAKLFARYQAATYGNYRTPVLQRIFDTLKPMRSILARELLGTALAAIEGHYDPGAVLQPRPQHGRLRKLRALAPIGVVCEGPARPVLRVPPLSRADGTGRSESTRQYPRGSGGPARPRSHPHAIHGQARSGRRACIHCRSKNVRRAFRRILASAGNPSAPLRDRIHWNLCTGNPSDPQSTAAASAWSAATICIRTFPLHWATAAPAQTAIMDLLRSLEDYQLESPAARPARAAASCSHEIPHQNGNVTVSVLLCNYNDARYLRDSLSAICTQSRLPEEVIVLDDGSTDDSLKIIEDFGRRYPFVRILKNETNRGLLYSINRALEEARCDFVVWAAADDRLMPQFLERNAQCLKRVPCGRDDILASGGLRGRLGRDHLVY